MGSHLEGLPNRWPLFALGRFGLVGGKGPAVGGMGEYLGVCEVGVPDPGESWG